MPRYNVFENENFVTEVEARTARNAIEKVERERGGFLFNPFAVNTQDANDSAGESIDVHHHSP